MLFGVGVGLFGFVVCFGWFDVCWGLIVVILVYYLLVVLRLVVGGSWVSCSFGFCALVSSFGWVCVRSCVLVVWVRFAIG